MALFAWAKRAKRALKRYVRAISGQVSLSGSVPAATDTNSQLPVRYIPKFPAWWRVARCRVPGAGRRADAGDSPGGHMTVLPSQAPGRRHDREEFSLRYALIVYLVKIVFAIMIWPGTGEASGRGRRGA